MASTWDEDKSCWAKNAAIVSLTAGSGTADNTVADVGGAFNQTTLNNNFADLAAKINAILAALRDANIIASD